MLLLIPLLATLAAAASSTSTATTSSLTTARYDNLPTATAVPANYRGLTYPGFTVCSGSQYLVPASGKNYISPANAFQATITTGNDDETYFKLHSAYIGCVTPYGDPNFAPDGYVAEDCNVTFTGVVPYLFGEPVSGVLVAYTAPANPAPSAPMQKVNLAGVEGSVVYFGVTSGGDGTALFIDNLVYQTY